MTGNDPFPPPAYGSPVFGQRTDPQTALPAVGNQRGHRLANPAVRLVNTRYGARNQTGIWPVRSVTSSAVRSNSARTGHGDCRSIHWSAQPCTAISWPRSEMSRARLGAASSRSPSTKKVAEVSSSPSKSRSQAGPSSSRRRLPSAASQGQLYQHVAVRAVGLLVDLPAVLRAAQVRQSERVPGGDAGSRPAVADRPSAPPDAVVSTPSIWPA